MSELKLVMPSEAYLSSYLEACIENAAEEVTTYTLHDPEQFGIWQHTIFKEYARQNRGWLLGRGIVPSTTFWSVIGDEFVGLGNIRHKLNPSLRRFGGNIGYMIRPSRWGQGLGTRQLALLLKEADSLGISLALVTCNRDNLGSRRVIEKNGGRYIDTIPNHIGGKDIETSRFWVPTRPEKQY